MIEIKNIAKKYKDKDALKGISMTLENGIYGFLGANGAGKTTLINIIAGVKKPTEGQILYNNEEIVKLGDDYREVLGYLPQKVAMYSNLTGMQYIDYMCILKGIKDKTEREKQITSVLEKFNLLDVKNKKIGAYSGGMQQRLAIAQSFIGHPRVVLLDEPTVGLDPEERIRFKSAISELAKDAIVIVSTHILSDLSELADVLCMFKQGNLVYIGKRQDWESENIDKKYLEIMEGAND